jgi:hypothetical protein
MSSIPNSAMPHAGPSQSQDDKQQTESGGGLGLNLSERAGKVAEYARENPGIAAAAGAAIVGAVAAAAIPLVRGRSSDDTGGNSKSRSRSSGKSSGSSGGKKNG